MQRQDRFKLLLKTGRTVKNIKSEADNIGTKMEADLNSYRV